MKYLTKTLYVAGCRCPKLLWLQYHDKGRPIDKFSQYLFESGNNVEQVAYRLFPNGILVNAGHASLDDLCVRTEKVMLAQPNYVFQGAFRWGMTLCITDVLKRRGNGWDLSEIKMSTKAKTEHIQDVAFQFYCLTKCNVEVIGKYVVHTNIGYIKRGETDPNELFISEDIGDRVELESLKVPENINAFWALLQKDRYPYQPMGKQCKYPYLCPYMDYCLSEGRIKPTCCNDIMINREAIIDFVSQIKPPIYFIDFETYQPVIPVFEGTRPFQNVPFQYSLHVLKGSLEHFSFLATNRQDPRRMLAESLLSHIEEEGSLIAWNAVFEIGCIKKLAEAFPDLRMDLLALIPRFVDLMQPFRRQYYCHPGFVGSCSLKNVLPVLVPHLDYKNLVISKAEDAYLAYHAYVNGGIDDAGWEMAQEGLLAYCGLDTAGMVAILEILKRETTCAAISSAA
jgi:hypothetical protein